MYVMKMTHAVWYHEYRTNFQYHLNKEI